MLLADLGLEGSLRSLAAGMTSSATTGRATFSSAIPRLADETELGVYRIAQEALANALRHAQALGLISMEERAQALGGQLTIDSGPGRGTIVRVELPLSAARE